MSVLARARHSFRSASLGKRQGLGPELQSFIGDRLRLYYADLLREPVPERLVNLLEKLDSPGGRRS
jgi:Anti-sigma factor NepR